jgi:hypothetical protein
MSALCKDNSAEDMASVAAGDEGAASAAVASAGAGAQVVVRQSSVLCAEQRVHLQVSVWGGGGGV